MQAQAPAGQTSALCKNAGEYCVNRETSSGACHVQETTESPLGVNILGPYTSRKNGVAAMCDIYDPGSADPTKCATVAPSGTCGQKTPALTRKQNANSVDSLDAQKSTYQLQACAIKRTIWTNPGLGTVTVTAKFWDDCHEREDTGRVSIYDKSGTQVGATRIIAHGQQPPIPLDVPPQGHIEYLCHSNSKTQELQCMFDIVVSNQAKLSERADKDPCSKVYPVPEGADQWTNCVKSGASACGGPDQCACDATERLVEYSCTEGKYNKCTADTACSAISRSRR
jgi:hypothetical protein